MVYTWQMPKMTHVHQQLLNMFWSLTQLLSGYINTGRDPYRKQMKEVKFLLILSGSPFHVNMSEADDT